MVVCIGIVLFCVWVGGGGGGLKLVEEWFVFKVWVNVNY